ncbi:hypothetical protein RN001_002892 [Aquatica leii]|uniref:Peptidase S1 domain-containing protein n=1 Tax=Aquatica leii TaxID=1421715 RepID=A0AAN7SDK6_9COLE|nr:hypothetical protein RN001_002892 [Aquatica leii]
MVIAVLFIVAIIVLTRPKSDKNLYERKTRKGLIVYHPYIVSLSTQLPNTEQRNFACTGVILSKRWILVGGNCVETEIEWRDLHIRAGSIYWYKDGTVHKVEQYFQSNYGALTAIKIFPLLEFNDYVDKVTFADIKDNWKLAYTIDWYAGEMKVYEKCLIQTWINKPCANTEHKLGELRDIGFCKLKLNEKPLISKKRVLIGFHIGVSKVEQKRLKHVFLDLQEGYYAQWVRNLVENNRNDIVVKTSVKDSLICSNFEIYACQPVSFRHFHKQFIKNNSTVIKKKVDKELKNTQFKIMDRRLNLDYNVGCVNNLKSNVNVKHISSVSTNVKDVHSSTKQTTLLTPTLQLLTLRKTVIRLAELTVAPLTVAPLKVVTNKETTETIETNVEVTDTTMTSISTLLITLLKSTSKSSTQTTEESIWDNLPFDESQFYNPV